MKKFVRRRKRYVLYSRVMNDYSITRLDYYSNYVRLVPQTLSS
jgi:hypothetical protein